MRSTLICGTVAKGGRRKIVTICPRLRVHETMSGGRHWVFRHAPGVRNSAGKIAPGVDVRGQGGYIIMPPSAGYSIVSDVEPAEWPDWLLELILSWPEPKRERFRPSPAARTRSATAPLIEFVPPERVRSISRFETRPLCLAASRTKRISAQRRPWAGYSPRSPQPLETASSRKRLPGGVRDGRP